MLYGIGSYEKTMKILVTGGCGFIGSHFIEEMIKRDDVEKVYNFDCLTSVSNKNLPFTDNDKYENYGFNLSQLGGTVTDYRIPLILEKIDVVVHFAAESHVDDSISNPDSFIHTNIVGTYNLISLCLKHWKDLDSKKFIHFSTDEVFGSLDLNDDSFTVNTPYRPGNPYAASKASADLLVKSFVETYGFPAVVLNSTNNFGSRQHHNKFIPRTLSLWEQGKPMTVYGTGEQIRDWFYVKDCVRCVERIIDTPIKESQYLIGGKNELTNLEVIDKLIKRYESITDSRSISYYEFVEDRKNHDFRYSVDINPFMDDYGISHTDFDDALTKTVEYYTGGRI